MRTIHHAFPSHLRTGRSIIGLARSPTDSLHRRSTAFLIPDRDSLLPPMKSLAWRPALPWWREYLITTALLAKWSADRLAKTKTSVRWKGLSHHGADYRNVVIFPEKFDGSMPDLTVLIRKSPLVHLDSYSPDLCYWANLSYHEAEPYHWDEMKIGPGAPRSKRTRMAFHLSRSFPNYGWIGHVWGCSS